MIFDWRTDVRRSEKEEKRIDFSHYSGEELLEGIKSENWDRMSLIDRVGLFQEMENRRAAMQGRPPATIQPLYSNRFYGQYYDQGNTISLNVSGVSPYESLDTYIHESNHANQYRSIQKSQGYDEHTLGMMQAEFSTDAVGNLYNYKSDSPLYDMQCTELDSNNCAATFLMNQRERYQDDTKYREYVKERANYFNQVNASLKQSQIARTEMQREQAKNSLERGDLSAQQYNTIELNLSNGGFIDSVSAQNHSVGGSIIDLNHQYTAES